MPYLAALCLALTVFTANDAQISLTAKVDKDKISLGEPFTLTITLSGDFRETPQIEAPQLDDFDVASSATESSFNLSGGEVKSKTELIYILLPQKEGELSIGEFKLVYEGKEYKSAVIHIEVGAAKVNPEPRRHKVSPRQIYPPKQAPKEKSPVKADGGVIL